MMTRQITLDINSKYYKKVLTILNSYNTQSRIIGGCVRDSLLGYHNYDIDIATPLLPDQTTALLTSHNIKVLPTGIKYGTVSAFIADEVFEITTLRSDINPIGRHTDVEFTDDYNKDAARRDFTINALSYCPFNETLYDYFNGYDDLKNRKVKFIGNASIRIKEDYLRILRFFRFSSKYADSLEQEGLSACIKLKECLSTLSRERILTEMNKLLINNNYIDIIEIMFKNGILSNLFPIHSFNKNYFLNLVNTIAELEDKLPVNQVIMVIYAILFWQSNIDFNELVTLKFSRKESQIIINLIDFAKNFSIEDKEFLLKELWLEHENYIQYLLFIRAINKISLSAVFEFLSRIKELSRPKFIISGHDLNALDIPKLQMSNILKLLKQKWIRSNFTLTKNELLTSLSS